MDWVTRLKINTASREANPCRTAHLLLSSPTSIGSTEQQWNGLRFEFEVGDGRQAVKLRGEQVEGRFGHRMLILSIPLPSVRSRQVDSSSSSTSIPALTRVPFAPRNQIDVALMFGGFSGMEDDEVALGQAHLLPIDFALANEDADDIDRDRRLMLDALVSNPQWLHLVPNNDEEEYIDMEKRVKDDRVKGKDKEQDEDVIAAEDKEGWYFWSPRSGGKWQRYSEEVSARLEAAWRKYSIAGMRLAATQTTGKQESKVFQSDEDEDEIETSTSEGKKKAIGKKGRKTNKRKEKLTMKDDSATRDERWRIAVDKERFVDVVKLVQCKFDKPHHSVAVKRVDADGSVVGGNARTGQGVEKQVARGWHSMVNMEEKGMVVVFGGRHKSHKNDVWGLDTRSFCWKWLDAGGKDKDVIRPSGRLGHSAVSFGGEMWVLGGFDSMGFACNDVWRFDVDRCEWRKVQALAEGAKEKKSKKNRKNKNIEREPLSVEQVGARYHHTAVVRKDKMLVFGGVGDDGKPVPNDVLEFDFYKSTWSKLKTKGDAPCGRWGHIGVLDDMTGRMVVHGGTEGKGVFLNDTHELDLETLTWHCVEVSGMGGRKGRAYGGGVCWKGNVVMFGGTTLSPDEPPVAELIELRKGQVLDMEDIPAELGMLIFGNGNLDAVDLARIGAVCRRWRELSMDDSLWTWPYAVHCGGLNPGGKSKRQLVMARLHDQWKTMQETKEIHLRITSSSRAQNALKDKRVRTSGNLLELNLAKLVPNAQKQAVKCVVVGDPYVGKSSTLITYTNNSFPEYVMGIWDNFSCDISWRGYPIAFALWDTDGQSEYDILRPLNYPQTDVFLLLFSIDRPESLNHILTKWIPELTKHCPGVPVVIAGNKTDLADDDEAKLRLAGLDQKMLEWEDGLSVAAEVGAARFRMYSALTQRGLKELFETVIEVGLSKVGSEDEASRERKNCCVQ